MAEQVGTGSALSTYINLAFHSATAFGLAMLLSVYHPKMKQMKNRLHKSGGSFDALRSSGDSMRSSKKFRSKQSAMSHAVSSQDRVSDLAPSDMELAVIPAAPPPRSNGKVSPRASAGSSLAFQELRTSLADQDI
mmetsp:Transcript_2072/g.3765  ORF Transcript_2072/g.3765 Transcript_2072/m.3765 type:complete len:135 (+) Transcript_2072:1545-1949(+)